VNAQKVLLILHTLRIMQPSRATLIHRATRDALRAPTCGGFSCDPSAYLRGDRPLVIVVA
jgi:hypothetical protein